MQVGGANSPDIDCDYETACPTAGRGLFRSRSDEVITRVSADSSIEEGMVNFHRMGERTEIPHPETVTSNVGISTFYAPISCQSCSIVAFCSSSRCWKLVLFFFVFLHKPCGLPQQQLDSDNKNNALARATIGYVLLVWQ